MQPIFLFNIAKGVEVRKGQPDSGDYQNILYEAVRQSWVVAKNWREKSPAYAVGLINGIGRTAFKIVEWHSAESVGKGRYKFDGERLKVEDERSLLRNYGLVAGGLLSSGLGYWKRGSHLVIRVSQDREIEIIRGEAVPTQTP